MSARSQAKPPKYLAADALIARLRQRFESFEDDRRSGSTLHRLAVCLMAAFAMFSLKEPSLLAFDARRQDRSLINLYRLGSIPFRHPAPVDPRSGRSRCFERMLRRPLLRTATRRSAQTLRLRRVIEDALGSNGPHIKDLIELNFSFILGAKPGDHA